MDRVRVTLVRMTLLAVTSVALALLLPGTAAAQPAGYDCKTQSQQNGGRCPVGSGCWEGEYGTCKLQLSIGSVGLEGDAAEEAEPEGIAIRCNCVPDPDQGLAGSLSRSQVFYGGGLMALAGLLPFLRSRRLATASRQRERRS